MIAFSSKEEFWESNISSFHSPDFSDGWSYKYFKSVKSTKSPDPWPHSHTFQGFAPAHIFSLSSLWNFSRTGAILTRPSRSGPCPGCPFFSYSLPAPGALSFSLDVFQKLSLILPSICSQSPWNHSGTFLIQLLVDLHFNGLSHMMCYRIHI